ncbi:MAG: PAS domain S-box protein [Pseudomonadota bacterium]
MSTIGLFEQAGETGALLASFDWAATSIGPIETWPLTMRGTLSFMLRSHVPIVSLWGPDGVMIYNDAYSRFAGARHPEIFGVNVLDAWPEVADLNAHVMAEVVGHGRTLSYKDQLLVLYRHGVAETLYTDLDYSPVPDDDGHPFGVMAIVVETTERVLARRWVDNERQRLTAMFEQAPGFIAMLAGPEHRFEFANPHYRLIVGNRPLIGLTVAEALPDAVEQGYLECLDTVYETGEAFVATAARYDVQAEAGGPIVERYLDFVYQPLRDVEGRVMGIFVDGIDVTARVQSEIQVREAEAQLRRAQEAGGIGLFTIDIATNRIRATPEFCRIFGITLVGDIDASQVEALIHPDDIDVISNRGRRLTGRAAVDVEYRIVRPDTGEIRLIARKGEYERDADGMPIRLTGIVQDITERRAIQRALRQSEADFAALAQAMPNQVWTARADGMLDWFNDRTYRFSGAADGALDGQGWTSIVHPDDLPAAGQRWAEALDTQKDYEIEFRLRGADGDYRWHLSRATPLRDADGQVSRWIGTNTDIHEQKLAEVANLRDRNRLWAMSQDLMLVCTLDGTVTAINPSTSRLLGWTEEEMIGADLTGFIHPEDREQTASQLRTLALGATTLAFENRYRTKAGDYRLLDWTAVPHEDRIHGVARDITEVRAIEDALRQSQKMEAVGQLTGGIAHDFNNLLQGITGSLDMLQARIKQGRLGELDRFVTGAMTSANRASALTHRLLAFSRRQPLDPRPVRANPLMGSMEDLLRRTLGENVDLELVLAGGLWLTRCDPNQLESAILNLAINARDAMPQGGKLVIETCNAHLDSVYAARDRDVKPGQYICICVTDTGTGMTADTIKRAFEPFFTTKPIGQGTGLGLSMIYGFARQSEGYARIYSEEGQGTTVKLYLPRFRGAADDGEQAHTDLIGAPGSDVGETVLVVEDEAVVRGLIVEVLDELGYKAIEAADGPKGLEILQSKRRIDLLVTDIGLPGLNGRQVADAGRLLRPGLKVLFMTGYAENAAFASGFLEPGMAMITKPFAMDVFANRIRTIIEGDGHD